MCFTRRKPDPTIRWRFLFPHFFPWECKASERRLGRTLTHIESAERRGLGWGESVTPRLSWARTVGGSGGAMLRGVFGWHWLQMTDDFSRTAVIFHNTIDIWRRITQRKVSIRLLEMCFVCTARPFMTNVINVIFFYLPFRWCDFWFSIRLYIKYSI